MKKILVVLAILIVGFVSYAVFEQMKKNAAMKEVRAAGERIDASAQRVEDFLQEEKRQQEGIFDGEPYVQLSGRVGPPDSEIQTETLVVPRGSRPVLFWKSVGAQSCAISPALTPTLTTSGTQVGTNTNGQTDPITKDTTFTITCVLKGGGVVTDTLRVRVE